MDCAYAGILSVQSVKQTVVIERMSPGHAQQQGRLIDNEQMLIPVEQSNGFFRVGDEVRRLWVYCKIHGQLGSSVRGARQRPKPAGND